MEMFSNIKNNLTEKFNDYLFCYPETRGITFSKLY